MRYRLQDPKRRTRLDAYPTGGARLLVHSHVIPPLPNRLAERVLLRGVDAVRPQGTIVAYDGLQLSLPIGSSEIRVTDLN